MLKRPLKLIVKKKLSDHEFLKDISNPEKKLKLGADPWAELQEKREEQFRELAVKNSQFQNQEI